MLNAWHENKGIWLIASIIYSHCLLWLPRAWDHFLGLGGKPFQCFCSARAMFKDEISRDVRLILSHLQDIMEQVGRACRKYAVCCYYGVMRESKAVDVCVLGLGAFMQTNELRENTGCIQFMGFRLQKYPGLNMLMWTRNLQEGVHFTGLCSVSQAFLATDISLPSLLSSFLPSLLVSSLPSFPPWLRGFLLPSLFCRAPHKVTSIESTVGSAQFASVKK